MLYKRTEARLFATHPYSTMRERQRVISRNPSFSILRPAVSHPLFFLFFPSFTSAGHRRAPDRRLERHRRGLHPAGGRTGNGHGADKRTRTRTQTRTTPPEANNHAPAAPPHLAPPPPPSVSPNRKHSRLNTFQFFRQTREEVASFFSHYGEVANVALVLDCGDFIKAELRIKKLRSIKAEAEAKVAAGAEAAPQWLCCCGGLANWRAKPSHPPMLHLSRALRPCPHASGGGAFATAPHACSLVRIAQTPPQHKPSKSPQDVPEPVRRHGQGGQGGAGRGRGHRAP